MFRHRRGFTLLELMVVVAIIAILSALSIAALSFVNQRGGLSRAPKQLMDVLETARNNALSNARDVVVVIATNAGQDAARCGVDVLPIEDPRCFRYWVLEDIVQDGISTPFDDASLVAFDPLDPAAENDNVIDRGYFPVSVILGKHAGFTDPAPPVGSVFRGIDFSTNCSFCVGTRALVRFRADGEVRIGNDPLARGGVMFFTAMAGTSTLPDTRLVTIVQPAGFITDRVGRLP